MTGRQVPPRQAGGEGGGQHRSQRLRGGTGGGRNRTEEKSPGGSQTAVACMRSMAGGAAATSASADKAAGAGRPKQPQEKRSRVAQPKRPGPAQTGLLAWPAGRTLRLPRRGRGGSLCWWPGPQHEPGPWGCGAVRRGRRRHEQPRGGEGGRPRGHGRRATDTSIVGPGAASPGGASHTGRAGW